MLGDIERRMNVASGARDKAFWRDDFWPGMFIGLSPPLCWLARGLAAYFSCLRRVWHCQKVSAKSHRQSESVAPLSGQAFFCAIGKMPNARQRVNLIKEFHGTTPCLRLPRKGALDGRSMCCAHQPPEPCNIRISVHKSLRQSQPGKGLLN